MAAQPFEQAETTGEDQHPQGARRPQEAIFQVPVLTVHAVMGPPEQRCWVERQQVVQPRPDQPNVNGAIVGALIGGVLGHEIGGHGAATVGGAVVGGAIGANAGGGGAEVYNRDVRRCENVATSGPPAYWDVSYNFRGLEHRVQLSAPPGPTIAVNGRGEPRD